MDILKECALAYQNLLNIQYNIIVGKKKKLSYITISFKKAEFHHLIGLQYLKDLPYLKEDRTKIFNQIVDDQISYEDLKKSPQFPEVEGRIYLFKHLEEFLDSDNLVFKYHSNANNYSLIQATYLLKNQYAGNDIYIFIDENPAPCMFYCRSFFQKGTRDYTANMPIMAVLYKEKYNIETNRSIIYMDKLSSQYPSDQDKATGLFGFYKSIEDAAKSKDQPKPHDKLIRVVEEESVIEKALSSKVDVVDLDDNCHTDGHYAEVDEPDD